MPTSWRIVTDAWAVWVHYVDLEIAGADSAVSLPRLAQHLRQCGVCLEEYEVLRDLVRSDHSVNPSSTDDLRSSL